MNSEREHEDANYPINITLRRMEWVIVYLNLYRGLRDPFQPKQDFEESCEVLAHFEKLLILHGVWSAEEIQEIHQHLPLQWTEKQPAEKP